MKDILVYVIIFLITILITGGILIYYYYHNRPLRDDAELFVLQDFLEVATPDTTVVEEEGASDFLERDQLAIDEAILAGLPEHERHFLTLLQQVRALNLGASVEDRTVDTEQEMRLLHAQMDSTIIAMIAQNDSLKSVIIHQMVDMNVLRERNRGLMRDISNLDDMIISLYETISDLREEIVILMTTVDIEEEDTEEMVVIEHDFRLVARLYNNMDNARVSQLLQRMEPTQAIEILKVMNQRKVAQIMGLLPPNVASEYSLLLMAN